ncbi:MAG: DNA recombination protein RmuC [Candidatus Glassbacteria bacterium]|nr:DNA recombination protein RmuC [Candidatus Glassbacteria bacterium]
MISWTVLGVFAAGFLAGFIVAFFFRKKKTAEIVDEVFRRFETQVRDSFGKMSLDALSKSIEVAQKNVEGLGVKELDSKKGLIDQQLQNMTAELKKVSDLVREIEKDREKKFGEITNQLKTTGEQTTALIQSTSTLREALASTKVRGQWGERMAEDVLRLTGFIENVNYEKQKTIEGIGTRPDFTFFLPDELKLNMDVKFPLDNYLKYVEVESEQDKAEYSKKFLKDVRARIKEITTRDYINPEQNTVDYVLLFIPNEQVYAFIHEQDSTIMDEGLKNRVVFCSPLTLYAILAVIRQAVDNFSLERTSNEILSLLGMFKKQWDAFVNKFETLGKRIASVQNEYETLTTTRRRALDRPLDRIEGLRTQRGLPIASADEDNEADSEVSDEDDA